MDVLSPQGVGGSRRNAGLCRSDAEVYVPFHFPWEKRHELSLWADFMGGDYMLVYEINERSLVRGLQYGRTVDKILEKLEAWAGEVPSSVTERLLDLKKRIGRHPVNMDVPENRKR